MTERKIAIIKDGPYIVTGNIPLTEKIIKPNGPGYVYQDGRVFDHGETYSLCRCGKTTTPPFCDGTHAHIDFDGEETASAKKFADRLISVTKGPTLDLLDDGRCALARFCHRKDGVVWALIKNSDDPKIREEAIIATIECPAGRLEVREKDGTIIEPYLEQEIVILQDPEKGCSGPLYIKGGIPIESSDGFTYEVRNRITLCRCGHSYNTPFCDAQHIRRNFNDKKR